MEQSAAATSVEHSGNNAARGLSQQGEQRPRPPSKKRVLWSHFVSVPLNGEAEQAILQQFKEDVAERFASTVPPAAFITPAKLHFTLCMVKLPTPELVGAAAAVLQDCRPEMCRIAAQAGCSSPAGSLQVPLAPGLATFPGRNLAKTTVLFRHPRAESAAQQVLHDVTALFIDAFNAAGILCSPIEELQLHMTTVNMRYAARGKSRPKPFHAADILEAYQAWPPATTAESPAVHLSVLSAPPEEDGYYHCALRMPFDEAVQAWQAPTQSPDKASER